MTGACLSSTEDRVELQAGQTERNWHLWSEGSEKCDWWG